MPRRPKAKPSRSHEEATVEGLCANPAFAAESLNSTREWRKVAVFASRWDLPRYWTLNGPAAVAEAFMPETTREKLSAFLNIIGRYMTEYSAKLELEHHESQLRLDIRNLTVVADTPDGPVPLYRMGSVENWVGYHVLASGIAK
jgi:hypothetical protein